MIVQMRFIVSAVALPDFCTRGPDSLIRAASQSNLALPERPGQRKKIGANSCLPGSITTKTREGIHMLPTKAMASIKSLALSVTAALFWRLSHRSPVHLERKLHI